MKSCEFGENFYQHDFVFPVLIHGKELLNYYVFHDHVTLFFVDNFSTECQITVKFLHNFF